MLLFSLTAVFSQDFKVLFVDDDDNVIESSQIITAVQNAGYTYTNTAAYSAVPTYQEIEKYDIILWYTGNDGVTNLWDADDTYIDQLELFVQNGGVLWVDGLDFLYDNYGSAPVSFSAGNFVYDFLGISDYLSQSYADDGGAGVSQYDISAGNMITTLDPVSWVYTSLWYADGLAITGTAHALYEMYDGGAYPLADQITALYNQVGTGTYITSGFRLAKVNNQTNTDLLVSSIFDYSANNWDSEYNSIYPVNTQIIIIDSDGSTLTTEESVGWDSREWKYSTTSGSGYVSFSAPETEKTYTPNFSSVGTYYIVCETTYGSTTVTSNEVQIDVENMPIDILVDNISGSPFLVSMQDNNFVDVSYTITGTFNVDNIFTAYLSDETGNFTNEVAIGTYTSTTNGTINAIIPAGTQSGTNYRIRIKSSNPAVTSNDNGVDFEIIQVTNDITPTDVQTLLLNETGNLLTVNESPVAEGREWLYSTTSGSEYISFSTPELGLTYTPTFNQAGTYYVVCHSTYDGGNISTISNEVQINVQTPFKILLVDDDDYTVEIAPVETALLNSGYTYSLTTTSSDGVPSLNVLEQFNIVIWYGGNDGILSLWDADSTYIDQVETYVENGGIFWADGLDIIYSVYGSAPIDFDQNDFIFNKLGISNYLSQSYADDGGAGVPQMDITPENKITTLNPVTWVYSTLWYADGLRITNNAVPLYVFGDNDYELAEQVNSLYRQENFGTYLTTGLRIAQLASQDDLDQIVLEIIEYAQQEPAVFCESIDQTTYYVSSTNATSIDIPYSIEGGFNFNSDNIFTAYLSDETGDFTNEIEIGSLSHTAADTIFATIPAGTTPGTAYRVRVKASNPALTSNDNGVDITIFTATVDVSPTDEQTIYVTQNGTELSVNETPVATSREWKYSTTSGTGYVSFSTPETNETYTPNFEEQGTFYIVCESTIEGSVVTSNQIIVNVLSSEITTEEITGSPFTVTNTTGANVDVPYTIVGSFNTDNIFTAYLSDETGDFTNEIVIGTFTSTTDGTITAQIPAGTGSGSAYRIRVKSDNPIVTGTDNGIDLIIDNQTNINSVTNSIFKVYPNPVTDIIYFEIDDIENTTVMIIDNLGRSIISKKLTNNNLNISNLQSGVYTILLLNNGDVKISHIIKI